ncbi:hypothetical protein RDV64_19800 [Acuticoccus sp. MNP-M23]|uniref:hypothetical protein n=1 Tax=Acuticoccus sp. MNP-M23 TaxID=3072793 RepID=UPI0028165555|nr:hypothetical protein [Acuticoccus sp. MNP-M23]WMS42282.1 hypothetical protein RDV64_19800 [Acuticoccus sp. MNP-M23]
MSNGSPQPQNPTWWDHHELTFWLWAALNNADRYFSSSNAFQAAIADMFNKDISTRSDVRTNLDDLKKQTTLAGYNFVTAMGVLIRVLERSQYLFPSIQPPYSRANHLQKEGKQIRNMIEHAYGKDGYLSGGGHHKDKFVRQEAGITADATSTIIKDGVHWLGNRLCVEKVVDEIRAIHEEADKIEAPKGDD